MYSRSFPSKIEDWSSGRLYTRFYDVGQSHVGQLFRNLQFVDTRDIFWIWFSMKTVLLFPFPSPQTILREIIMKVFQTICAWITGGTPLVFYRETPLAGVVFPLRRVFPVARVSLPLPLKTKRQWILFCLLSKGGPVWIGRYQGLAHLRKWSTIEHHRQGCPCPAQEATVSSMLSCTQHTQLQEPSFGPLCKGIQSFLIKCFKCCILSRFTRVKLGMIIERSKFPQIANVRFG